MSLATEFAPTVPVPVSGSARARLRLAPESYADPFAEPLLEPCDPARGLAPVRVLRAPSRVEYAAPLRLTRRGVAVLTLAVCALGAALVWLAGLSSDTPRTAGVPASASVTVTPGDTLWSIATRVAPQRDPRAEVATLQRLNHLSGVDLSVGQVLRLH